MLVLVRPIQRQIRGNLSVIVILACVYLLYHFLGLHREPRISTTHQLRSPYAQLRREPEEIYIPTILRKESPAVDKDADSHKNSAPLNKTPMVKKQVKKRTTSRQKSKARSNGSVNGKGRPDLTMTTKTRGYRYILNVPKACSNPPELIVVVCSVPTNFEKRTAVRQTWGSDLSDPEFKIKLVFLTGSSVTSENQRKLRQESNKFKDIVQKDFVDSYMNLTVKSLVMLEWVTDYCLNSKYLLKADDDMYFNLPNLVRALRQHKEERFIIGHLHDKGVPVRDRRSKWYIPKEMYSKDSYPPFTVGVGYAMTTKASRTLYHTAQVMSFFPMEDVFLTGIVGSKAGIPRYNHNGFYDKWRAPSCNYTRTIAEHKHEPDEMRAIHRIVTQGDC